MHEEINAQLATINTALLSLHDRISTVEVHLRSIADGLENSAEAKEWYTTAEVAELLGRRQYTVQEKWCNQGRIECVKGDDDKWRIPGHEVERLLKGGGLLPPAPL